MKIPRSTVVVKITELEVQIRELKFRAQDSRLSEEERYTAEEQIGKKSLDLAEEKDRLRVIDEQWVLQQEEEISRMKRASMQMEPGQRAALERQIAEYQERINKRKESLYAST